MEHGVIKEHRSGHTVFLIRTKKEPGGIVGSGYVLTAPRRDTTMKKGTYAAVAFTMPLNVDADRFSVIPLETLDSKSALAKPCWNVGGGGPV